MFKDGEVGRHKVTGEWIQPPNATQDGKIPPGFRKLPNGDMQAIPGGPADVKTSEKRQQDFSSMQASFQSLDALARDANELALHPGLKGNYGLQGVLPNLPGGQAADANAKLLSLKAKSAFTTLQDMRNSSKTGGALGAVSDKEMALLQANIAALDKAQSYEQVVQEFKKIVDYTSTAKSRIAAAYNDHWNNDKAGAKGVADPNAPALGAPKPGAPAAPAKASDPQGPIRVNTPEEAAKLPSGTIFLTPDGRTKVAP
jgi:hypothetical protein